MNAGIGQTPEGGESHDDQLPLPQEEKKKKKTIAFPYIILSRSELATLYRFEPPTSPKKTSLSIQAGISIRSIASIISPACLFAVVVAPEAAPAFVVVSLGVQR